MHVLQRLDDPRHLLVKNKALNGRDVEATFSVWLEKNIKKGKLLVVFGGCHNA